MWHFELNGHQHGAGNMLWGMRVMATRTSVETVDGTLTNKDGVKRKVRLRLTIKSLMGQHGAEATEVAKTELLRGSNVADGEYTLEYFYLELRRYSVRVQFGQLISRGI
jgi:hypothetical protein